MQDIILKVMYVYNIILFVSLLLCGCLEKLNLLLDFNYLVSSSRHLTSIFFLHLLVCRFYSFSSSFPAIILIPFKGLKI